MKTFTKPMRSAFALAVVAGLLAACAPGANGMGVTFGMVTGRVVDTQTLQPIAGATIAVGNIVAVTAAIDQGGFVLRNVPAGTQTLTITAVGWKGYQTTVTVGAGKTVDVGTIGLPSALSR